MLPRPLLFALASFVRRSRIFTSTLAVTRLEIQIPNLPKSLDGFCIAHVSDLHVGGADWIPVHAAEAADVIHAERPDAVINSGDFLQWDPDLQSVYRVVKPFVGAGYPPDEAPPTIAVLGNHDYFVDPPMIQSLQEGLRDLGSHVLLNDSFCVRRHGGELSIIGLTHHSGNIEEGLQALTNASRPRVAIVHEPDLIEWFPWGSADLVLAGHTHGGQMTVPGLSGWIARRFGKTAYGDGLYTVNGIMMYVNRGLGTTGLPIRFQARPEVAIIRLVR